MNATRWNRVLPRYCLAGTALLIGTPAVAMARITTPQTPLTPQSALTYVQSLLKRFGVHQPLRDQGIIPHSNPPSTNPAVWSVGVTDSGGNRYGGVISSDLGWISLWGGGALGPTAGASLHPLSNLASERRVRGWMASLGTKNHVQLDSFTVDDKGIGHAFFGIRIHDHPFVAYPHWGYSFSFDAATGAFLAFNALQNPPPGAPGRPKLDKVEALAALKKIWDTEISPRAINTYGWRRVWYTLGGEPKLGYYLPEGQHNAILVWQIHFDSERDVRVAVQGGDDAMLIDAVTGRQITTKMWPG